MIQHLIRVFLVTEGDVPEFHIALHICQRHRVLLVSDVRRDIHDLTEPGVAGISVLELLRKVDQLLHRFCEIGHVQKEGDQIGDLHGIGGNQPGSHQHHGDGHRRQHGVQHRIVGSHVEIAVALGGQEAVVALAELLHLDLFVGKGFHHSDPGEVILDLPVDIRHLHPVLPVRVLHFPVQEKREADDKGQKAGHRQGQGAVDAA